MIRKPMLAAVLVVGLAPVAGEVSALEGDRYLNGGEYDGLMRDTVGHPNERARWRGVWALDNGRPAAAVEQFQRAAAYGDKTSQHLLTLMYWHGDRIEADPVKAYIWADLAAERGTDPRLLAIREKIWLSLSPEQQRQARQLGPGYYERYGDERAMPRTEAAMRRLARSRTGSRVGATSSDLDILIGGSASGPQKPNSLNQVASGSGGMSAAVLYDGDRLSPDRYWQAENQALGRLMRDEVIVRELEPIRDAPGE